LESNLDQDIDNLSNSQIPLESLMDGIPMGMALISKNRKVVFVNRAFEALTGFSKSEAQGLPCWHVLRSKHCVRDCPVLRMKDDSEPLCVDSDIINKDRQLIPVRLNTSPLMSTDMNLTGFVETIEDLRPIRELDQKVSQAFSFSQLIGRSPQMEKIYKLLPILAQNDSSVLITGETGTGKDLVAEAIHQASNRAKSPFIKVNCGTLPETLLESELFGHTKGAFTGAVANKPGRFRLAHNGTLYLTEIGDLPLSLQVKLLTFLDDQVINPVGSTKGFQADVRIMGGTHCNLEKMVKEGTFREDLFFRLNVIRVHLPPLRERENDPRLLLDHFLNDLNSKLGKNISGFTPEALKVLNDYPFPGNVRELKNITEYTVNICQGGKIDADHLPAYIFEARTSTEIADEPGPVEVQVPQRAQQPVAENNEKKTWFDQERQLIMDALLKSGGRRNDAAEFLGWGRSTLWRKMKQHKII
jgi:two-component system, NtrC family, response regulator AtoC